MSLATIPAASTGWLDRLNSWRTSVGLSSLTENTTWSAGDYNHAAYMVKNDLVTHYETVGTPNYTSAGDTAAKNSNIYVSSSTSTTDVQAIDWWMQAPFHAMGLMDPRLTSTGFGSYRQYKSGWEMGAAVDVLRGNSFAGGKYPVYFPGDGSTEPLTTYEGNEFPNPLSACTTYTAPTGLPVFIEVGGNVATTVGPVHTFTGNGVALSHCVIDSNNAAVGANLKSRGGVILVPKAPLKSGVKYVVSMTVNGKPYTWSFTVGPLSWGTWSGSVDMSAVPTTWKAGESKTFPVTVTNLGNMKWPSTGYNRVDLDLHFTSVAGGSVKSAKWLNSLAFSLPADLAPAASVTLPVTFAAPPTTGGSLTLEALMIKEHQFWFDTKTSSPVQWAPVTVTVAQAGYDLSKAPLAWKAGQSQTFSVTITNTSNVIWISTGYNRFDLDFHFATVVGGSAQQAHWLTSKAYTPPSDVAPGASVTFNVTVVAPSATGAMFLEAEMIKEHVYWFRETAAEAVTVS